MGALASYRLGDQRLLALGVRAEEEHRRVELHEFEVGDLRTGTERERDTVTCGDRGVGGGGEDLAHAPGGQDHGRGMDGTDAVVLALAHDMEGDSGRTAVGIRQQVQDQGVFDGAQLAGVYRLDERAGDLGARRVASRVRDTAPVVAALAGELDLTGLGGVEVRAGGDQPAYGVGTLGDQGADRVLVAQARARDQGVVQMLLRGVAVAQRGGDAALRPARGAVVQAGLGDHDRAQPGGRAAQRGGQTRDSGADHDDVGLDGPAGAGALSRIPVMLGLRRSGGCCRSGASHRPARRPRGSPRRCGRPGPR